MLKLETRTEGTLVIRRYASVPMLRSAHRVCSSKAPWLSFDPNMQADCSAAVRAARLIMFALFALFSSPVKSNAAVLEDASEMEMLKRKVESQQRQIDELKTMIAKQHRTTVKVEQAGMAQSPQTSANETTASAGRSEKAVSDPKRDPLHLEIKRDHAPPQQAEKKDAYRFNGLLQAWFTTGNFNRDTFRLRRTELRFGGDITPKLKWTIMFDPAKLLSANTASTFTSSGTIASTTSINQGSRVLQDAFISYNHSEPLGFDAGQFKLPLSLEGVQGPGSLDTVERALFLSDRSRGGALGDIRDTGIQLRSAFGKSVEAQVAVANGLGEQQNDLDRDEGKAFLGRVVIRPGSRALQLGASGAWSVDNGSVRGHRNRLGGELVFQHLLLKLKSELMSGNDFGVARLGGYAHMGLRFRWLEPIFRFDYFDPDVSAESAASNVIERDYVAGANYYLREHNAKLQFNYLRKTFTREVSPNRNLFLINLQTSW